MEVFPLPKKRWRHKLVMAFEKASEPGITTLSPLCNPDTESTMDVSKVVTPVTLMERMVYSFGTLEFCKASKAGSTEVMVVSWAYEIPVNADNAVIRTRDRILCI